VQGLGAGSLRRDLHRRFPGPALEQTFWGFISPQARKGNSLPGFSRAVSKGKLFGDAFGDTLVMDSAELVAAVAKKGYVEVEARVRWSGARTDVLWKSRWILIEDTFFVLTYKDDASKSLR
jgi:hypothetical protein